MAAPDSVPALPAPLIAHDCPIISPVHGNDPTPSLLLPQSAHSAKGESREQRAVANADYQVQFKSAQASSSSHKRCVIPISLIPRPSSLVLLIFSPIRHANLMHTSLKYIRPPWILAATVNSTYNLTDPRTYLHLQVLKNAPRQKELHFCRRRVDARR